MNLVKKYFKNLVRNFGYDIVKYNGKPQSVTDLQTFLALFFFNDLDNFFIVQVGANDGVRSDPVYDFITKYNFAGLLIEPQAEPYRQLKVNYADYPKLNFANVAVGEADTEKNFYTIKSEYVDDYNARIPGDASGISSFVKEHVQNHVRKHVPEASDEMLIDSYIAENKILTKTFKTLFSEYDVQRVDMLQIDVEGYDYEIIKLFDFTTYQPKLVVYENRHIPDDGASACEEYLKNHGYMLFPHESNTCAVHQSVFA